MTNKVKPFFIRITDDMTPQMVQDAFDKCVDAGANVGDCVSGITQKYECESSYTINTFKFFGVTDSHVLNSTRFYMKEIDFGKTAQEITLGQLDEWLGLDVEREWDGKGLPPVGAECEILFKEYPHKGFGLFNVLAYHGGAIWVKYVGPLENNGKCYTADRSALEFRKPETPEQKAERERLEAVKEMCEAIGDSLYKGAYESMSALYDAGYRKQ